jgi:hypothetical protein
LLTIKNGEIPCVFARVISMNTSLRIYRRISAWL